MEFCENVMVSGDYYHHQQEQLLGPPPISSLDDLFSSQNMEVDMSLEWLSVFVEDCFSSSGNCLQVPANQPPKTNIQTPKNTKSKEDKPQKNPPRDPKKFEIPVKARSKRKRITRIRSPLTSWSSEDPPLLQQTHWLADSKLMTPKEIHGSTDTSQSDNLVISEGCFPTSKQYPVVSLLYPCFSEKMANPGITSKKSIHVQVQSVSSEKSDQALQEAEEKGAVVRKCSHCQSMKTPQWRAGPMGPKTLCNACGVRYKSGRLFPEYRPAKSPTFVSYLHSNSHKKVLEMRLAFDG